MALVVFRSRCTTLVLRYVERKPDGSFQYRRRIPMALRDRYGGKCFFVRSLKRDVTRVGDLAASLTAQLDSIWQASNGGNQIEADEQHRLSNVSLSTLSLALDRKVPSDESPLSFDQKHRHGGALSRYPTMKNALSLYLSMHPNGSKPKFIADNTRAVTRLTERVGDLQLNLYDRSQAEDYRDNMLRTQSSGTVRRRLRMISAIVNKAIKEKQLQMLNPFEGLGIVGEGEDGTKRVPFTTHELGIVSTACRNLDDDIRHIVGFQIDTGCRVAEIVGLRIEDVILDAPVPHVRIRPWGKIRTLKTPASERDIPLIGNALWAAERALEARRIAKGAYPWLFPRYASDQAIKATHASNTMNKWLRSLAGICDKKTTHCLRHAMRDRLRAVQVPHDIQDVIGGWGTRTIGQGYGSGYPLAVVADHMHKIVLS